MEVLKRQNYRRATWKNGLGYTDEIAIYPPGAELRLGNFSWRLSSAQIAQNSPFSVFPDHDRTLVIVSGAGVRLTHTFEEDTEDTVELPALSPYDFPGDVPSRCELLSGTVTDLSVFIRKAEFEAITSVKEVAAGETYTWIPSGRWNFAFSAQGIFEIFTPSDSQKTLRLEDFDTLQVSLEHPDASSEGICLRSTSKKGKLILVIIQ